ncbi:MAG: LysM peptidoglycan-binding domain-containing protein [Bacteroidales bacterium]|jgi:membrane-bound lytic murein transglycosylase D|nr:LysM peptidoglycan-binding domain-containing protein [Bacteroidales bacterium]
MQKHKTYLLFFLFIGILFGGCTQLKNISKKPISTKLEKAQIKQLNLSQEQITLSELSVTEISDTLIEPSADRLSEVNQVFDTLAFAAFFENKFGNNHNLSKDSSMMTGSAILQQLDSLAALKIFDRYHFEKDTAVLNVYGFKANEHPVYSDSVYALRIAVLNSQTPIDLEYNQHVKGYINMYSGRGHKQTARMLGLAEIYFPLFEASLDKYNIPLEIKYLAVVESALNPTAGSRAGAKGLWQFMYATGKMYGLNQTSLVDDRFDPYKATEAACQHMLDLFAIYNDWNLVLAAYNSGPGNVNRAIRRAGGVKDYWAIWPFLPRETRGYIPAFIAVNYVFNYAAEHNIFPSDPGILYNQIDSITVRDAISFDQIAEFMNLPIEDVKFLNPAYKEGIIPAVNGQKYVLRLPRKYINYFIDHEDSLYAFKSEKGIEHEKLLAKIKEAKQRSIHFVRSGENLGLIAQKYRTSVSRLKAWNGLRNSRIYPGQKLIVYNAGNAPTTSNVSKRNPPINGYHTVKYGENLGLISKKYGVSVNQIKSWNDINSNLIKPGQKLRVKTVRQKTQAASSLTDGKIIYHTVRSGDTLWDIAKEYNSTINSIKELNQMGSSSKLKPGQKLKVQVRT